VELLNRIYRLG